MNLHDLESRGSGFSYEDNPVVRWKLDRSSQGVHGTTVTGSQCVPLGDWLKCWAMSTRFRIVQHSSTDSMNTLTTWRILQHRFLDDAVNQHASDLAQGQ
uniref:MH2 domain-containing protein n=1 Tax=Mesocestoides corti TaxID=53468 RepID=A0A5K3FPH7_MESCO